MIREPYNLNPYNSTIDTSKVNNFGFTFSGDELGSWQVEIAKNNSSPEVLYTSGEFVPSNVGYEHIYDGDRVEGMTLPSTFATNTEDDGLLRSGGTAFYILTVSDRDKSWNNDDLKVQINNNTFDIHTVGDVVDGYRQLTITANPLPRLPVDTIVQYIVYNSAEAGASDYFDTLGEDLIWRLKLYEPNKGSNDNSDIINFIKGGRLLQDASNRIASDTYEGETSLTILENSTLQSGPTEVYVQIGQDFYVENKTVSDATTTITGTIAPASNETDLQNFAAILPEKYLEIDNFLYQITGCTYATNSYYLTLTLTTTDSAAANALSKRQFYDYTVEFENLGTGYIYLPNSYVNKYCYEVPNATFGLKIGSGDINIIQRLYYWVYSDGTTRSFYTLASPVSGTIRNQTYRLYSNFYISNWYFFQSRETPTLTLQAKTTGNTYSNFPLSDFSNRQIELKGSYSQSDGIGVRYHTWEIDKVTSSGTTEILKTDEIYNSNFNYTYEPLDDESSYIITFTVVNQAGVGISVSGNLTTQLNLQDIDAACTATVNSDNHTVEITWLNGLGAEPEEENDDFGNRISVGTTGQDVRITEQLTYSTISGGNIEIPKDEILVQTGLVINDDAKADGNNKEFYNSDILTLGSQSGSVHFHKEGLNVKIEDGDTWFTLLNDVDGQVSTTIAARTNYFIGSNYVWDDNSTWKDSTYIWAETQSNTNCYYYQFVIGAGQNDNEEVCGKAKGKRAVYYNLTEGFSIDRGENYDTITIPYNPLIDTITLIPKDPEVSGSTSNLRIRVNNDETQAYDIDEKTLNGSNIILELNTTLPESEPTQIVVYDAIGEELLSGTDYDFDINTSVPYNKFILGHDTNYFYFTVSNNATSYASTDPLDFGTKPSWPTNSNAMLINARFNGTLLSSRQEDIGSSIDGYQVYRRKFRILGSDGMTPIYDEENPIYTRLIGTFYLADEGLTTAAKFKFIDWTVENRGIFDYAIVPISNNASVAATIHTKKISDGVYEKVITDWYGWSFSSFNKFPTGHYEPLERWLFKLNVETNGYSHQTNKIFHQGFNRYPKASIGVTNYITTTLSCLIGNIDKELKHSVLYRARQGYTNDTIDKIEDWEDFSGGSELVLVKDYKGRVFIGVIDGNTMSFQDVVVEILTQLSFNITQIDGIENYSIFSVEEV